MQQNQFRRLHMTSCEPGITKRVKPNPRAIPDSLPETNIEVTVKSEECDILQSTSQEFERVQLRNESQRAWAEVNKLTTLLEVERSDVQKLKKNIEELQNSLEGIQAKYQQSNLERENLLTQIQTLNKQLHQSEEKRIGETHQVQLEKKESEVVNKYLRDQLEEQKMTSQKIQEQNQMFRDQIYELTMIARIFNYQQVQPLRTSANVGPSTKLEQTRYTGEVLSHNSILVPPTNQQQYQQVFQQQQPQPQLQPIPQVQAQPQPQPQSQPQPQQVQEVSMEKKTKKIDKSKEKKCDHKKYETKIKNQKEEIESYVQELNFQKTKISQLEANLCEVQKQKFDLEKELKDLKSKMVMDKKPNVIVPINLIHDDQLEEIKKWKEKSQELEQKNLTLQSCFDYNKLLQKQLASKNQQIEGLERQISLFNQSSQKTNLEFQKKTAEYKAGLDSKNKELKEAYETISKLKAQNPPQKSVKPSLP